MRPSSRLLSLAGLAFGALLTVAACSSAASTPAQSVLGATAGTGITIGESSSTSLGSFLTGPNGMTLYFFTKDSADKSTCSGQCATFWPALTVTSGGTVTGPADATAGFATIARADGTTQVTYNHMPLYYFASDKAAGDTKGQGVQGVWFVAPVSGVLPSEAASAAASSVPSTGANTGSGLTLGSTDTALGTFLTGPNGMTLYFFTKDSADKSTCSGQCAAYWPPLTVTSGATITGPASAALGFGTITRADGTTQVTYNHLPLYYFASDKAAGDTTGQGVQGVWFVASVNGLTAPAATPAMSYGY
jgi:predicted lipoprotein with Yx(FWY)xxD motif